MTESEFNKKVAAVELAYIDLHIITYDEWYDYMMRLIKEKEGKK